MQRFNLLRVWRRLGGSHSALAIALAATLVVGVFGSGALLISHAARQGVPATRHPVRHPGQAKKQDEAAWFQLSHFGDKAPPADAAVKARAQAAKLPMSPLGRAAPPTGTSATATTGSQSYAGISTVSGNWSPLGPRPVANGATEYDAGRVTALAVSPTDSNNIWIGTAWGGVWHSTDGGATWAPMTDNQGTLAIGSIAIDPSNANTIYVGTGEANNNIDAYPGIGILKSTDGGATWTQLGFSTFGGLGIAKIAVDPHNSSNVLVAVDQVYGQANGTSTPPGGGTPANGGIYRSTDGGSTWGRPLGGYNSSGTDVVFDPAHPGVVYAGLGLGTSGAANGLWKSTDSGATWNAPIGNIAAFLNGIYRTAVGISADGQHVYAVFTDASSANFGKLISNAIWVTADGGSTWAMKTVPTAMATDDGGRGAEQQWWYESAVAVDPTVSTGQTAYVGGVDVWKTTDGGTTWTNITQAYGSTTHIHPDFHAITMFSSTSSSIYLGNDGGVWTSTDGGSTYNNKNAGLNITQFYSGSVGEVGSSAQLYGGAQDNGLDAYPGAPAFAGAVVWHEALGGDGGHTVVDPTNNAYVYGEFPGGVMYMTPNGGTNWYYADYKNDGHGFPGNVNWVMPFALSPNNSAELLAGTDRVFRSTDRGNAYYDASNNFLGTSWNAISPVLSEQFVCSNCGYPLSAVAVAQGNDSTIYAGDNNSHIYVTTNNGTNWRAVSLPWATGMVTSIAVDPTNSNVAYATAANFSGAAGRHVYKSTDAGASWSDISTSLPNIPFESVVVNPRNPNTVIAGSDAGVFESPDGGATWLQLGTGLPNTPINQLFLSPSGSAVYVATHGRGMWAIAFPDIKLDTPRIELATAPGQNPASQTVHLSNDGVGTLNWSAGSLPSWVTVTPSSGSLAAGNSTALTISFNITGTTSQTYSANLTISDPAAADSPSSLPITVVATNVSTQWYFAEGYMGPGFDTLIALANPNPAHAHVTITYHLDKAPWVVTHSGIDLAPYGRFTDGVTKFVRAQPGADPTYPYGVATTITSDQPIVAERPMYFNNYANGFDVMGATHLSSTFAFDDLNASPGYLTILTFLNPTNAPMYANMTFFDAATGAATTQQYVIPANARGGYDVGQHVPAPGLYSGLVTLTSDQAGTTPVQGLIERPMYWNNPKTGFYNGECVMGVAAPQAEWDFAEGWTNPGGANQGTFHETLYLAHPAAAGAADAHATVTIYREDGGAPVTVNVTLPQGQLKTVDVNAALPPTNSKGNSIKVTADQPILAERLMTWDEGATDVLGAQQTAQTAYFAEGYTGGGFTGILTLENPNATPAHLTVISLPAHDADPSTVPPPVTMTWTIPANARSGFGVNPIMPNQGFATLIVSDQPILAERVMYFNGGQAGTDAVGYQGAP